MMSPALLAFVQFLLQYGPGATKALVDVWHKQDPTTTDFLSVLDAIAAENYDSGLAAYRASHGLTPVPPLAPPVPTVAYFATLTTKPNDTDCFNLDRVYASPDKTLWWVEPAVGLGAQPQRPATFTLDHTVTR